MSKPNVKCNHVNVIEKPRPKKLKETRKIFPIICTIPFKYNNTSPLQIWPDAKPRFQIDLRKEL